MSSDLPSSVTSMWVLYLADLRLAQHQLVPFARATSKEALEWLVEAERVIPYPREDVVKVCLANGHEEMPWPPQKKFFRKGGPLEWGDQPLFEAEIHDFRDPYPYDRHPPGADTENSAETRRKIAAQYFSEVGPTIVELLGLPSADETPTPTLGDNRLPLGAEVVTTHDRGRFSVGARVFATSDAGDDDWSDGARDCVQWGAEGTIVGAHDSHGLFYEVKHEDGRIAPYSADELEPAWDPARCVFIFAGQEWSLSRTEALVALGRLRIAIESTWSDGPNGQDPRLDALARDNDALKKANDDFADAISVLPGATRRDAIENARQAIIELREVRKRIAAAEVLAEHWANEGPSNLEWLQNRIDARHDCARELRAALAKGTP